MSDSSLRDDLLSIPGVEGAEIEGSADKPAGLRIRIAEGADQRAVGGAIRRVLTSHGLGTDTRLPGETDGEATKPIAAVPDPDVPDHEDRDAEPMSEEAATAVAVADEPRPSDRTPVIDLTDSGLEPGDGEATEREDIESGAIEPEAVEPEPGEWPTDDAELSVFDEEEPEPREDEPFEAAFSRPRSAESESVESRPVGSERVEPEAAPNTAAPEAPDELDGGVARLASVSVEEGRDGIVIAVTTTAGERVRQAAASTEGGVESAVVRATARLALPHAPDATVVDIEDRRVEGVDIVMIVLDVDGRLHAGSAVVAAGRAFALGRATWAALTL